MLKIIFHVNENDQWHRAINNISNLLKLEERIEIELLVHGEAIGNLLKPKIGGSLDIAVLQQLEKQGGSVAVCHNTMTKQGLDAGDLYDGAVIVPAGVYELALKQQQGFAYIKP
ncbi:DsrE family protein [Shewanella sp. GXUN23E]|uniref:DsrE family protein n=1 Tax=Shewanella sp. GXUN23E TaxID=3422498 RepID=UPI003D7D1447